MEMTVNRREFSMLLGGAAAPLVQRAYAQQNAQQKNAPPANPVPRPDWVARRKEPILEPGLKIIDPHHHLWQRPDWRYLLDDLLADTGSGHNVVGTVYMEANSMYRDRGPEEMRPVGEVEFANGIAAMCSSGAFGKTRVAAGIVGHADMTLGSRVEPVINALMRAGGDRFRGIRHGVSWEGEAAKIRPNPSTHPGMLADKRFREGIAVLDRLGLSYDVSLYHTQIPEVADLAGALPNTKIVLNHVGGVSGWALTAAGKRKCLPSGRRRSRRLRPGPMCTLSSAGWARATRPCASTGTPNRRPLSRWPPAFAHTLKPASAHSERRAVCLRATFQSTRSRTAITCFGMPAS